MLTSDTEWDCMSNILLCAKFLYHVLLKCRWRACSAHVHRRLGCVVLFTGWFHRCTRLLLNSSVDLLRVIKLRCWKLNLIKKIVNRRTRPPLTLKQMSRRMIDSPRCCFIPFIGWKFDASTHTSVRFIGEINRWIKQRSLTVCWCSVGVDVFC